MTRTPHQQTVTAAYLGCAAAASYAVLKVAWGLGSTVGVNAAPVAWEGFLAVMGGPMIALWGTVLLALLATAILLSLVQPWGRRVPRQVRASLAWLGFTVMALIGLIRLGETVAAVIAGNPFVLLSPAIYIYVYACFVALGLSFAVTAWRTRELSRTPASAPSNTAPRHVPSIANRQEHR